MFVQNKKSFTLIEMLIVIVIIGILAAALIPRLQSIQGRARDTKRKADLATIRNGLEVYYSDNGLYPRSYVRNQYHFSTNNLPLRMTGLENIVTSLPVDPINNYQGLNSDPNILGDKVNAPNQYAYSYYYYGPVSNVASYNGVGVYMLYTVLENDKDPERCELKQYKTPSPSGFRSWCALPTNFPNVYLAGFHVFNGS